MHVILRGNMLCRGRNTDINQAMLGSGTFNLAVITKITSYLAINPLISNDAPSPVRQVLYWAINLLHAKEYLTFVHDINTRRREWHL
jgi:hypothetical protein